MDLIQNQNFQGKRNPFNDRFRVSPTGLPRKCKSCSDNMYPESLEFISRQVSSPIPAQQSTIGCLLLTPFMDSEPKKWALFPCFLDPLYFSKDSFDLKKFELGLRVRLNG